MTLLYHPRPERWPQVSLRGLLVSTTLVALLVPWWVAEYRAWERRSQIWESHDWMWRPLLRTGKSMQEAELLLSGNGENPTDQTKVD